MKGRIATLEGQARRSDATQKALRKYVIMLERKVKEQSALLKGEGKSLGDEAVVLEKEDRSNLVNEKLRCELQPVRPIGSIGH
jgi:striatin 1/3/4